MRTLYLIRHGTPDFPPGARICLGRTDTPLGPLGRMQACQLGAVLGERPVSAVFSSPLSRAVETAVFLSPSPVILDGLRELDTGDWDGLDFSHIQTRWPEHYSARGRDPSLPPPNGEDMADAQQRFIRAVEQALRSSTGDIAIVAHSSVNQTLLCHTLGRSPYEGRRWKLPYASYCVLEVDSDGFHLVQTAQTPCPPLTAALAARLLAAAGPPERVRAHCMAVAAEAARIADALPQELNRALLTAAAVLHDVARTEPKHPETGANWLRILGYEQAANLVARHHDLTYNRLDEVSLLCLADQCVQGTRRVSLEERFARSRERCRTPEAQQAWHSRFEAARRMREQVNRCAGWSVIR